MVPPLETPTLDENRQSRGSVLQLAGGSGNWSAYGFPEQTPSSVTELETATIELAKSTTHDEISPIVTLLHFATEAAQPERMDAVADLTAPASTLTLLTAVKQASYSILHEGRVMVTVPPPAFVLDSAAISLAQSRPAREGARPSK
jgi:hypothetical protein